MMRVGLIDVDGRRGRSPYPNLALMKISAWHKGRGDTVEWYGPFGGRYDVAYLSKVFSRTPDYPYPVDADAVVRGGTGYAMAGPGGEDYDGALDVPLPAEVEHCRPDYGLYGIRGRAYGFMSRGCPRGCAFCIVGKKEGMRSAKAADLEEFWAGEREVVLHDPNVLACRERFEILGQLARSGARVDFNQGLDARLLTEEACEALGEVRLEVPRFSWDDPADGGRILPNLARFARGRRRDSHGTAGTVYVLTNHGSTHEEDLWRVEELRGIGYAPYVMVYDKENAPAETRALQRWVNNRRIFWSVPRFEDYRRTPGRRGGGGDGGAELPLAWEEEAQTERELT